MRRAALRARISKLERQTKTRRWPQVCAGIYDCSDDFLVGVGGQLDGVSVQTVRHPGETLQELAARTFASGTVLNLAAIYRQSVAPEPPRREADQMPKRTPVTAPGPSVGIPEVGQISSFEELQRMDAIPVPPERRIN